MTIHHAKLTIATIKTTEDMDRIQKRFIEPEFDRTQARLDAVRMLATMMEMQKKIIGLSSTAEPIVKMLELSTIHVKQETSKWLDEQVLLSCAIITIYDKEDYGWFIPLTEETLSEPKVPKDLAIVLKYAKEHGCSWVMFDQDCDEGEVDLPVYEWGTHGMN